MYLTGSAEAVSEETRLRTVLYSWARALGWAAVGSAVMPNIAEAGLILTLVTSAVTPATEAG